jgi:hypothetical protein
MFYNLYVNKSIDRFLDQSQKVVIWPKLQSDKELVLAYLADKFEFDHDYHENEVNEILKSWHTFSDWPLLRRELFEREYFDRDLSGTAYERLK